MFCTKCGKEIIEGARFCTKCGTPVKNTVEYENKQIKKPVKKTAKKINFGIIALVIILVAAILGTLGFIGYLAYEKLVVSESPKIEDADFDEDVSDEESEEKDTDESASDTDNDEKTEAESVSDNAAEAEETESESAASKDDNISDWCDIYSSYLKSLMADDLVIEGADYKLIFVNDDDIPELVIGGTCEAEGNRILTIDKDSNVDMMYTSRLGYSYIEKGNLLNNSDGHMGYYYDLIYSINDDGKWELVAEGYNTEEPTGEKVEFSFTWNGEEVKRKKYFKELEAVYDPKKSVRVNYDYSAPITSYDDMIDMLDTRNVKYAETKSRFFTDSKDIHDYEIIVSDVSWYEAKTQAEERGGYLVRINSMKEYDYIVDMIKDQNQEDKIFFIAGTRNYGSNHYNWINNNYEYEITDLESDNEFEDIWLDGEPSYDGVNADGMSEPETCMDMFYYKAENKFVWNDIPEFILDAVPSYQGKIAYIVEYE